MGKNPRLQANWAWKRGFVTMLFIGRVGNPAACYFAIGGMSTLSMMWMVPLEHFTSAVVTLDLFR